MKKRLMAAMAAYLAIAILAAFTLDGGLMRNGVWVLMAFFAVKSYIAYRAGWTQSGGGQRQDEDERTRIEPR